tara:strand:- start:578 stop:1432 length:855 start_codon:yes stop_codon:yes gene_type:complete
MKSLIELRNNRFQLNITNHYFAGFFILYVLCFCSVVFAFDDKDLIKLKTTGECQGCDLKRANLSHLDLSGANLKRAKLKSANLRGAILKNADLSYTDLYRADLSYVDLTDAILILADLLDANLSYANLERADLSMAGMNFVNAIGANFKDAKLRSAYLEQAELNSANLDRTDFSHANLYKTTLLDSKNTRTMDSIDMYSGVRLEILRGAEFTLQEMYVASYYGKYVEGILRTGPLFCRTLMPSGSFFNGVTESEGCICDESIWNIHAFDAETVEIACPKLMVID